MLVSVAVGGPDLARFADGGFDFVPLLVAAAALLVMRTFGIRIRWQLVLGTVLAAPLLVALADRISYPMTLALVVAGTAAVATGIRRDPKRRIT